MLARIIYFIFCFALSLIKPLQIFQQTSYRINESAKVIFSKPSLLAWNIFGIIALFLSLLSISLYFPLSLVFAISSLLLYLVKRKKSIVKTNRLKRLIAVVGLIIALVSVLSILSRYFFLVLFLPFITLFLASLIISPIEKKISNKFIKSAKQKLEREKPLVIAVTGSFGKTTFKNILAHILSSQYSVFTSPQSYNTPIGLAKCINESESLGNIFIAEAGARYVGDIAEICNFISPKFAVITAITNQHLSTFKTEENLKKEKLSLLCSSVTTAFFNTDNIKNIDFYSFNKKVYLSGQSGDITYSNIKIENGKQSFCLSDNKKSFCVSCPLLAPYIPSLVCTAVSVAKSLGIQEKNIKNAINTLKPIAHRLELLYNNRDVIIDDAYNSNEQGFMRGIDLLSTFSQKTKVVITPGVVELGKNQPIINERLALYAKDKVDLILCYGINAKAIKRGGQEKCEVYSSLKECMVRYKEIQGERAVLFENDLPDVH